MREAGSLHGISDAGGATRRPSRLQPTNNVVLVTSRQTGSIALGRPAGPGRHPPALRPPPGPGSGWRSGTVKTHRQKRVIGRPAGGVAELPDGDWDAGKLPAAVLAVGGRALRTAEHPGSPGEIAFARVLSRSGRWIALHGASLVTGARRRVAVIVEPAHPARINPLLMAAYGLTEREQEITRLVLQCESTAQIAERLVLSPHTVQEHLKHIFEEDRGEQPPRPGWQSLLLPLRASPARQRTLSARRTPGARRPDASGRASPLTTNRVGAPHPGHVRR